MRPLIVIATRNRGKSAEIREFLADLPAEFRDLTDFGPIPEVVEDGVTFDENAYKKALFTARCLGLPALADDSGLEVAALGGAPGVHSARYAGEGATDAQNNEKLLRELAGAPDRSARFVCVLSFAVPSGPALTFEGTAQGLILPAPRGEGGFGYDPLFLHPPTGKTFAEMTPREKLAVSHRGAALREFRNDFPRVLIWLSARMREIREAIGMTGCGA